MPLAADPIPDKANELMALPGLLTQRNLAGAIGTMDAIGYQKNLGKH